MNGVWLEFPSNTTEIGHGFSAQIKAGRGAMDVSSA